MTAVNTHSKIKIKTRRVIKITGIKSGTRMTSVLSTNVLSGQINGQMIYSRIQPKKPSVERAGDNVKICHFYNGLKECLGTKCFWVKIGKCPIHERLRLKELRTRKIVAK